MAIGRKNWLFCGSDRGGRTAVVRFSLIATCQRYKVDPFAYLRDVSTRMPAHGAQCNGAATPMSRLNQFLSDRWRAARQATPSAR